MLNIKPDKIQKPQFHSGQIQFFFWTHKKNCIICELRIFILWYFISFNNYPFNHVFNYFAA